jgi:hypothetical protein
MPDAIEAISGAFAVLIIFLGISSPIIVIALVYYLKKRLEHKQIMAAIEKGTPLSELRPPKPTGPLWIRSFTIGIALLLISLPFLFQFLRPLIRSDHVCDEALMPGAIFLAVGLAFFIRGLLLRKAEKKRQAFDSKQSGSG